MRYFISYSKVFDELKLGAAQITEKGIESIDLDHEIIIAKKYLFAKELHSLFIYFANKKVILIQAKTVLSKEQREFIRNVYLLYNARQ